MANLAVKKSSISEQDYLESELTSQTKHEYVDGVIYAMTGASRVHNRLSGSLYAKFLSHLSDAPCEPFIADIKVQAEKNYYYPDLVVDCGSDADTAQDDAYDAYIASKPKLIIEVLSPNTRKHDLSSKFASYQTIETLEEYAVVEQDVMRVDIFRKTDDWAGTRYESGDEVEFLSIGLRLPIAEIYERVELSEQLTGKPIRLARDLKHKTT